MVINKRQDKVDKFALLVRADPTHLFIGCLPRTTAYPLATHRRSKGKLDADLGLGCYFLVWRENPTLEMGGTFMDLDTMEALCLLMSPLLVRFVEGLVSLAHPQPAWAS